MGKSGFGGIASLFFAQKQRKSSFLLHHLLRTQRRYRLSSANTAMGNAEGSSPRVALACRDSRWSEPRQGEREHKRLLLPCRTPLMEARSASMPALPAGTCHAVPPPLHMGHRTPRRHNTGEEVVCPKLDSFPHNTTSVITALTLH